MLPGPPTLLTMSAAVFEAMAVSFDDLPEWVDTGRSSSHEEAAIVAMLAASRDRAPLRSSTSGCRDDDVS